jgi:hypothetical protein
MAEHDPYASPYHLVEVPGLPQVVSSNWPMPLPMPSVDFVEWRRPSSMTGAFWFWLAAILLAVIGLPGVFALDHEAYAGSLMNEPVPSGEPAFTRDSAGFTAVYTSLVYGVVLAVMSIPYVIGLIRLRVGSSAARVLMAVLGGVGLIFGLVMLVLFAEGMEYANWVYGVIWSFLFLGSTLLGIVLMFLPASNTYVRGSGR